MQDCVFQVKQDKSSFVLPLDETLCTLLICVSVGAAALNALREALGVNIWVPFLSLYHIFKLNCNSPSK